jgi:enoyl-CoA hydratase
MDSILSYSLSGGVATLAMDDGKANVMSVRMLTELAAAFTRAEQDRAVVLLTGRDGLFSGGFDLAVFKRDRAELARMLEAGARLSQQMLDFPRPIAALVNGHAIAMGAFLLLGCDLRLGVDRESRVQLNEVQIGMTLPRFAIEVCRHRLAAPALHAAANLAQAFTPQQALAAGFFTELLKPEGAAATAQERARALAALHAESFTNTKRRLTENARAAMRAAVEGDVAEWTTMFLPRPA